MVAVSLFIVTPLVEFCNCSMPCCVRFENMCIFLACNKERIC